MLASALLEEYNQSSPLPIDIDALDAEIESFAKLLRLNSITSESELHSLSPELNSTLASDSSLIKKSNPAVATPNKTASSKQLPKTANNTFKYTVHTVKAGESLYRIALRYNVTVDAIVKKNNLKNPKAIKPGQKILIPKK
jgi:LysM repeat protein